MSPDSTANFCDEPRGHDPGGPGLTATVVVPAYNAASLIEETLDSLGAQTLSPHEVIVIDDGSRDETASIAESHPVVHHVIRRSNGGICAARNDGIEVATGDLVLTLDADDLWHPRYIERMTALMRAHPTALSGFARCVAWLHPTSVPSPFESSLDDACRLHDFESYHRAMMHGFPILPSFHVARREALHRIGIRPYLEHQRQGEAAYLFGLLAAMGPVAEHVHPLGRYRMHADAVTGDELDAASRVPPCLDDLRTTVAARSDLVGEIGIRRLVDRHAAAWYRRCGRRLGGGGRRQEARRLFARAARLGDHHAAGMLAASFIPGLGRRVWVRGWRPDIARRETAASVRS